MKQDLLSLAFVYLIGFLLVLYFRKEEWYILAILLVVFVYVLYFFFDKIKWHSVLLLTLLFCSVENICVYYGLWTYNRTKYPMPFVPVWLYLAWCLSIIFIVLIVAAA